MQRSKREHCILKNVKIMYINGEKDENVCVFFLPVSTRDKEKVDIIDHRPAVPVRNQRLPQAVLTRVVCFYIERVF